MISIKELTEIYLSHMWEKSFDNENIIYICINDEIKEAKVLNTYSYFGENIDEIELLINGIKERYNIQNKNIKYYKKD